MPPIDAAIPGTAFGGARRYRTVPPTGARGPGGGGKRVRGYHPGPMSTRKLIVAALLCGLAILIAFTIQVVIATR